MKKNNSTNLFTPAPFFMHRSHLYSTDYFDAFIHSADRKEFLLQFFHDHPPFQEAIAIASPSLYEMLSQKKITSQVVESLMKYFLRAVSRPTPFGLFSFVSFGFLGSHLQVEWSLSDIQNVARVDMEWIYEFGLQLTEESTQHLSLKKNPLVYLSQGRAILDYPRAKEEKDHLERISIRSSYLIDEIFRITSKPVTLHTLQDKIEEKYPNLDRDKVKRVLDSLIEQQFLIYELLPTPLTPSSFRDLVKRAPSRELDEVEQNLSSYNDKRAGEGGQDFLKTTSHLQSILEKDFPKQKALQVDAVASHTTPSLPHFVAKEVNEACSLLWRLTHSSLNQDPLVPYHGRFAEAYGFHQSIPIMELFDENRGLGVPEIYQKDYHQKGDFWKESSPLKKWVKEKVFDSIRSRSLEITLQKSDLDYLIEDVDEEKAFPSFDVFFELKEKEDVKQEKFDIVLTNFVLQGGASFGRFSHVFHEEQISELESFLQSEEKLLPESTFVESSYLPNFSRGANVASHPALREWTLDLSYGREKDLALEEIYIGATPTKFYATTKNGEKEFFFTHTNVLNPTYAPHHLRFLRDIAKMEFSPILPWNWFDLENAPFLPRVRYKNVILSLARWQYTPPLSRTLDSKKTFQDFTTWADAWNVPQRVLLGRDDQLIPIDRNHPYFSDMIIRLIQREGTIIVKEQTDTNLSLQTGSYRSEFVLPFRKKEPYEKKRSEPLVQYKHIPTENRVFFPGDSWLHFKIYLSEYKENNFITDILTPFVNQLMSKGLVHQWFFIRYTEERKNHLRVRLCNQELFPTTEVLSQLNTWISQLINYKFISDFTLEPYIREIERYGGEEMIESAENLFCADTKVSTDLLSLLEHKQTQLPEKIIAPLSIIALVQELIPRQNELFAFLKFESDNKQGLAGIREWKKELPILAQSLLSRDAALSQEIGFQEDLQQLLDIFTQWEAAKEEYRNSLLSAKDKGTQTTHFGNILNSLIHMHVNRLLGYEREKEEAARSYASFAISKISRMGSLQSL